MFALTLDKMKLFVVLVIFCVTLSTVLAEYEDEDDYGNEVGEQFEERQRLATMIEKRKKKGKKWGRKYSFFIDL